MFNEAYNKCAVCGIVTDDGGLNNGEFNFHDCLDKQDKQE